MNKKGFTLVELLAIIIIIGVIALITTPIVTGIINSSKKETFSMTCEQIYNAYEQYEIQEETIIGEDDCIIFDFNSDRYETELIEGIKYEPIDKLNIKGEIPKSGIYKICGEEKRIIIDNDSYTCIGDGDNFEILDGKIEDNDRTAPIIKDVVLSSTTNSIKVVVQAIEDEGIIAKYYYRMNGVEVISESGIYTYINLKEDTEYEIEVEVENKSGLKSQKVIRKINTKNIDSAEYDVMNTPEDTEYATSKRVQILFDQQDGLKYYFKSTVKATVGNGVIKASCGIGVEPAQCQEITTTDVSPDVWYESSSKMPSLIYKGEGILYTITTDDVNEPAISTYNITKIDITNPNILIETEGIKTDRVNLNVTCRDDESGITKYEYSKDNGITWVDNGTNSSYTFTKLNKETSYSFKARCTNGSGLTESANTKSNTLGFTNPKIEETSETITNGYTWATERQIQIKYNNINIKNPEYYFKSNVNATVETGIVIGMCGTETVPEECTNSSVTTLVANTWYRTSNMTPIIKFVKEGFLYALTSDGTNISGTSTYEISKVSSGSPSAPVITGGSTSWSSNAKTISVSTKSTETSGIAKYQYYISTSSSSPTGGSWVDCSTSGTSQSISTNGTKYIYFRAVANNGKASSVSNAETTMIDTGSPSAPVITGGSTSWSSSAKTIRVSTESTSISNIMKYQYYISTSSSSQTGGSWTDCSTSGTSQTISTNGTRYIFFRAINNANTPGPTSNVQTIKIDTSAPGTTSITYNGGSNTCSWKNNYNLTLSASDNIGIKHYEIDVNNDGKADSTTGSNFIPWNGFSTDTARFRAVDNAENKGAWTSNQHIHMDTENPTVKASVNGKTVTFTITDNVGAIGYGVEQSSTSVKNWTTFASTTSTTIIWTASAAGDYAVWVEDHAGNKGTATFTISASAICAYSVGQTWDFGYSTSGPQQFTVPCSGTYKLEVWGAQGGGHTYYSNGESGTGNRGGYGGYSSGNVSLTKENNIYVVVGGQGGLGATGGYNGGANNPGANGAGGGATHIGTFNNTLAGHGSTAGLYIVAGGGGGGGSTHLSGSVNGSPITSSGLIGGAGGGTTGGSGIDPIGTAGTAGCGAGATQSSAGSGGGFGYGGIPTNSWDGGAGGGGLYGGGAGANYNGGMPGGGGSGYIGGVTSGSMANGQRSGDGYARITLISIN